MLGQFRLRFGLKTLVAVNGYPHSFRLVGRYGDADLLRVGRSQPNIHPGLRGVLRPRFRLRIPARSVALRIAGGNLVSGRRATMAEATCGTCLTCASQVRSDRHPNDNASIARHCLI